MRRPQRPYCPAPPTQKHSHVSPCCFFFPSAGCWEAGRRSEDGSPFEVSAARWSWGRWLTSINQRADLAAGLVPPGTHLCRFSGSFSASSAHPSPVCSSFPWKFIKSRWKRLTERQRLVFLDHFAAARTSRPPLKVLEPLVQHVF